MSALPGNLSTDQQPPMTVPLRHFLVALAFLLVAVLVGLGDAVGAVPGLASLATLHLFLVGWVAVTIMGAMTQFVPVWSGVALHSRRFANAQLLLVTVGLVGFAGALFAGNLAVLAAFGAVMLCGFWLFVYNISRTLTAVGGYDVTERHFLIALLFFLGFTALGAVLAANLRSPVLASTPFTHDGVLGAHVALAVFGAVLTTIYGALYQLATMFTQTNLDALDSRLQHAESVAHPTGVVLLAGGRLVDAALAAQVGGLLVLGAAIAVGVVVGRRLHSMQVERTPMHSRYAVVALSLPAWALLTLPAWVQQPTARETLLGAPQTRYLLLGGVVGFVILGSMYHIVPFVVWVHEYSDLLGHEAVPMVDDLYDDRLAAADFTLLLVGLLLLVAGDFGVGPPVSTVGGILVALGVLVVVTNLLLVIVRHSSRPVSTLALGRPRHRQPDSEGGGTPERN